MDAELSLKEMKELWHGSLRSYLIGFGVSLVFTLVSFYLVGYKVLAKEQLIITISGLALGQFLVQMLFFLNVGTEGKPHWETICFFFMLLIMLIVVIGSLWIMNDLDNRMMPDHTEMHHD